MLHIIHCWKIRIAQVGGFLDELLNNISTTNTDLDIEASGGYDDELIARLLKFGHCKDMEIVGWVAQEKTVTTLLNLLIYEPNKTQIMEQVDCLHLIFSVLKNGWMTGRGECCSYTLQFICGP